MKTRIISGVTGLILLFIIMWSPRTVLGIAVFVLSIIGLHEFYNSVSKAEYRPVKSIGYVLCLPILFFTLTDSFYRIDSYGKLLASIKIFSLGMFIALVILFSITIFKHARFNLNDIALTLFGVFYIVFLFSFVVLTRNLEGGFYYVWLIFIGAFATDTFAYFTGMKLGKNKLLPEISPKKTVEGSLGGVAGCILIALLYGVFINYMHYLRPIPLYHFIVLGLLCGIISQIGDWAASAIKRYVKVKDYGNIMPGHGGVLDRFDSILFVAPVVYYYISFIIL